MNVDIDIKSFIYFAIGSIVGVEIAQMYPDPWISMIAIWLGFILGDIIYSAISGKKS